MLIPTTPSAEIDVSMESIWRCYSSPEIQDLAWLIFSPRLISTFSEFKPFLFQDSNQSFEPWLQSLNHKYTTKPATLRHLPKRHTFKRLGLYFEALFKFILENHLPTQNIYSAIDHHLQVYAEAKTLGEIDFILSNAEHQKTHVELAVKYYLFSNKIPSNTAPKKQSERHLWVGPNANDRLDIKFDRLFQRQLTLSKTKSFTEQYPELNTITARSHYISGLLFHHWTAPFIPPQHCNRYCLRGHWLYRAEFKQLITAGCYTWKYLNKLAWLGGRATGVDLTSEKDVCALLANYSPYRALCFERYSRELPARYLGRVMVVPDYWPTTKAP